ncbi:MAG: hypothetical protein JNL13_14945 [Chitinophagaceae bacterium]|nr:hypothetical protein [Chitinophagaceae bacterium]
MKKLVTIVALMMLTVVSKAQMSSVTFTQNVETGAGSFTFVLMGHNTAPPACAVSDITTPYGAVFGLPSTVTPGTAAWSGPGASWISRIKMYNRRTGGNFDHPFCMLSPGIAPITFSDGTTYHISFTFTSPTSINVVLNP